MCCPSWWKAFGSCFCSSVLQVHLCTLWCRPASYQPHHHLPQWGPLCAAPHGEEVSSARGAGLWGGTVAGVDIFQWLCKQGGWTSPVCLVICPRRGPRRWVWAGDWWCGCFFKVSAGSYCIVLVMGSLAAGKGLLDLPPQMGNGQYDLGLEDCGTRGGKCGLPDVAEGMGLGRCILTEICSQSPARVHVSGGGAILLRTGWAVFQAESWLKETSEPNGLPGLPWGFSHRPCCTYRTPAILCQYLLMSEYQ